MRRVSFLILSVSLLMALHSVCAYTVVLKSGKIVEGKWIAEDGETIQLKDPRGVFLSVKKRMVDLNGTAQKNRIITNPIPQERSVKKERSIVDIANEAKMERTGNVRVVTREDLNSTPAISVFGSDQTENANPEAENVPAVTPRSERYWRDQAEKLKRAVSDAADKRNEAKAECSEARERGNVRISKRRSNEVLVLGPSTEPRECRRVRELDMRWEELNRRWLEFEERARREDIPWQWLE